MGKYVAKVNLTLGVKGEPHKHVKKGDVFECDDAYAEEHFEDHHVDEAEEGQVVTIKAKKLSKLQKKAADKKAKEDALEAKKAAKADKE